MALTEQQKQEWERDGFIILRGFAKPETGRAMEAEIIDAIRADPPSNHQGVPAYPTKGELFIMPEAKPGDGANPEDLISKVFNPHLSGAAKSFAHHATIAEIVAELLDAPISVFQSQFILKNPGAWGQPWHQDSYYFPFDRQPQIGVWLAISEAALENGCLSVLPGSHKDDIHEHGPDLRPGSNQGYLEVKGRDYANAIPVLMEPGDLLVFHSYLLHRSEDNRSASSRSAMVYHYGRTGTQPARALLPAQKLILRWEEVAR
jgi:phytanoyl-CoA hydroxylase